MQTHSPTEMGRMEEDIEVVGPIRTLGVPLGREEIGTIMIIGTEIETECPLVIVHRRSEAVEAMSIHIYPATDETIHDGGRTGHHEKSVHPGMIVDDGTVRMTDGLIGIHEPEAAADLQSWIDGIEMPTEDKPCKIVRKTGFH